MSKRRQKPEERPLVERLARGAFQLAIEGGTQVAVDWEQLPAIDRDARMEEAGEWVRVLDVLKLNPEQLREELHELERELSTGIRFGATKLGWHDVHELREALELRAEGLKTAIKAMEKQKLSPEEPEAKIETMRRFLRLTDPNGQGDAADEAETAARASGDSKDDRQMELPTAQAPAVVQAQSDPFADEVAPDLELAQMIDAFRAAGLELDPDEVSRWDDDAQAEAIEYLRAREHYAALQEEGKTDCDSPPELPHFIGAASVKVEDVVEELSLLGNDVCDEEAATRMRAHLRLYDRGHQHYVALWAVRENDLREYEDFESVSLEPLEVPHAILDWRVGVSPIEQDGVRAYVGRSWLLDTVNGEPVTAEDGGDCAFVVVRGGEEGEELLGKYGDLDAAVRAAWLFNHQDERPVHHHDDPFAEAMLRALAATHAARLGWGDLAAQDRVSDREIDDRIVASLGHPPIEGGCAIDVEGGRVLWGRNGNDAPLMRFGDRLPYPPFLTVQVNGQEEHIEGLQLYAACRELFGFKDREPSMASAAREAGEGMAREFEAEGDVEGAEVRLQAEHTAEVKKALARAGYSIELSDLSLMNDADLEVAIQFAHGVEGGGDVTVPDFLRDLLDSPAAVPEEAPPSFKEAGQLAQRLVKLGASGATDRVVARWSNNERAMASMWADEGEAAQLVGETVPAAPDVVRKLMAQQPERYVVVGSRKPVKIVDVTTGETVPGADNLTKSQAAAMAKGWNAAGVHGEVPGAEPAPLPELSEEQRKIIDGGPYEVVKQEGLQPGADLYRVQNAAHVRTSGRSRTDAEQAARSFNASRVFLMRERGLSVEEPAAAAPAPEAEPYDMPDAVLDDHVVQPDPPVADLREHPELVALLKAKPGGSGTATPRALLLLHSIAHSAGAAARWKERMREGATDEGITQDIGGELGEKANGSLGVVGKWAARGGIHPQVAIRPEGAPEGEMLRSLDYGRAIRELLGIPMPRAKEEQAEPAEFCVDCFTDLEGGVCPNPDCPSYEGAA